MHKGQAKGRELRTINIEHQSWPIDGVFRISRGSVSHIDVIQVTISENGHKGRGECRPYGRYDETPQTVAAQISSIAKAVEKGASSEDIQSLLPAGAARNAVDCALWDLQAKISGTPVYELAGLPPPKPRSTAFTLSVNTPRKIAKAARNAPTYPILKLKIDGIKGLKSCLAVLDARPDVQLIIDANEALSPDELVIFRQALAEFPVLLIEQPVPAGRDALVSHSPLSLPIVCADESLHTRADLQKLWDAGYRAVNVKLDKTGGFSEALALMRAAKSMGFLIMAGCMVGTSLAMAPMMVLESLADFIDLDGPLLLAKDMDNGISYAQAKIYPPRPELWG